jgi:hypothetical protein
MLDQRAVETLCDTILLRRVMDGELSFDTLIFWYLLNSVLRYSPPLSEQSFFIFAPGVWRFSSVS